MTRDRLVSVARLAPGMKAQIVPGRYDTVSIVLAEVADREHVLVVTGVDFEEPLDSQQPGFYRLPTHLMVSVRA